jgi:hypothetical protein
MMKSNTQSLGILGGVVICSLTLGAGCTEQIEGTSAEAVTTSEQALQCGSGTNRIAPVKGQPNVYRLKASALDSLDSVFRAFECFAKSRYLVWPFEYRADELTEEERAARYAKQRADFAEAAGLAPDAALRPGQVIKLELDAYDAALFEQDSPFPLFKPLRERLGFTGKLVETPAARLRQLLARDARIEVAALDFSLREGGRSWDWKLAKPLVAETVNGLPAVAFDTKPYFDADHPEWGGDLHGVSGGVTKQLAIAERPDTSSATHYVFYVATLGTDDFFVSVEFFDYDRETDIDQDGFSNNPHHVERDWANETEAEYLVRYDRTFMQAGFEKLLLQRSGGLVDEYEFAKHRYDGYRYREFGVDGPKAQKLKILASPDGSPRLYRVALPFTPRFMAKEYINTAVGNGVIDIRPEELQRVQYVFYVTPKEELSRKEAAPITDYQRLRSLRQYYYDATNAPADASSPEYLGKTRVQGAIGEVGRFVRDRLNEGQLVITPVLP